MNKVNFLYCEPDLKNYDGHLFNTAKFLSNKISGIKNIHLKFCLDENCDQRIINELKANSVFTQRPQIKIKKINFIKVFFAFNFYIFKGLRKVILTSEKKNIIYFNTAQHLHLLAIIFILLLYSKKIKGCILTFRLTFFIHKKKIKKYSIYLFLLKFLEFFKKKVILHTDTKNIYEQLEKITKLNKYLMPIPHAKEYDFKRKKIFISFLGSARKEKKSFDSIRKIFHSNEIYKLRSNFCFIIHCFGPQKDKIIRLLKKYKNKFTIKLKLYPLNYHEYYEDLKNSSVSIFNYSDEYYEHQSSGIFTESIFYNTIPLVSNNTWMSSILYNCNLKDLIIKNDDSLAKSLVHVIKNMEFYNYSIRHNLIKFKKFHSTDNFVKLLKIQIAKLKL